MSITKPQPLILASASPRRRALLSQAGYVFETRPADIDETRRLGEPAERYVQRLAEAKARASWAPGARSLGADTVVCIGDTVFGKPRDAEDAVRILTTLAGRQHSVLTGAALFDGSKTKYRCTESKVWLRDLSNTEIENYVRSGEPLDKAGAYAIQGRALKFVAQIQGSASNVVGLSLRVVAEMLG